MFQQNGAIKQGVESRGSGKPGIDLRRATKRFPNDSWAADQNVASSVGARIWSAIKGKAPGRNKTKRLPDFSKRLE